MLILNHTQVRELLPMRDCMEVVGEALADLARGDGEQPLRSSIWTTDTECELCWMPGSLAAGKPFGIKIIPLRGAACNKKAMSSMPARQETALIRTARCT